MMASGLNIVNGWNGMLAEVMAALGGAHRNQGSMAWQRYFTTSAAATAHPVESSARESSLSVKKEATLNTSGVKQVQADISPVDTGFSQLLSDCGLSRISAEDWRKVMDSSLVLAAGNPSHKTFLISNIMDQYHRHTSTMMSVPVKPVSPRPHHPSWLNIRSYSSLSWPHRRTALWPSRDRIARSSLSLRYFFTKSSRIYRLEDYANCNPNDAGAQADYLKAVVDSDPEYVIRRVESGRYAVNAEVDNIYNRALRMSGYARQTTSTRSTPGMFEPSDESVAGDRGSSVQNPIYVSLNQKTTWSDEILGLLRRGLYLILSLMIIIYVLKSETLNSVRNSTNPMQGKYAPDNSAKKYTFEDVQGVDEAKEEIQEIVHFLKNPEIFKRLGAKLPTGVLLIGQPGTGKTLLAKAIAGEANVPFLFVSGSEFDEMFVGVGASRVRKLFETAKSLKPCVLFIDELDAVGGKRFSSPVHPYSRMTLNQLLVELDGYLELEGVVVIGATNFPDALDSALTRPGRFDTSITLSMPDVRARHKILEVHAKKILLDPVIDMKKIARNTAGFSGADLANLVNQAALRASVLNKKCVTYSDMEYARERILMGREIRSRVIPEEEKKNTAYHEAGHAIVALFTPSSKPIHKATIIPRGPALGMVSYVNDDMITLKKCELLAMIDVSLAGQMAEEIIFGKENVTTGASSDFKKASEIATRMIVTYGMSRLGKFSHELDNCGPNRRKEVEAEISKILEESQNRVKELLQTHAEEHKRLAEGLLKYETLDLEEMKIVISGKPLNREI